MGDFAIYAYPCTCAGCMPTTRRIVAARSVIAFFEGLFRLHAHATFRAGMARSGRPVCDSFEMGAEHQVEGHETCARCLWSRRSHYP